MLITLENNVLSSSSPILLIKGTSSNFWARNNSVDFMYLITLILNEIDDREDNEAK